MCSKICDICASPMRVRRAESRKRGVVFTFLVCMNLECGGFKVIAESAGDV